MTDYYNPIAEIFKDMKPMQKITITISEPECESNKDINALLNVLFNKMFKHGSSNQINETRDRFEGVVTLYGVTKEGKEYLEKNQKS